ncbi:polyphosphate--glucose phosphotransferase [Boudabousia marimammalium]|uniref:Polyphosphate glucokinase n=1 Tax=Boudabousia marimammalium TaxID=156892 RepID=A0A1Q5PNW8_9ACTO|nr:ROK family protein [Boudabousia marimammalium]OKL49202.1 polyphosphate glucokinase [Boudabousia marimammalium]
MKTAFGIDIGGSGIKGALVNLETGGFIGEQFLIPTPQPSTPEAVTDACAEMISHFNLAPDIPVGITFPAPVKNDTVRFVANLDQSWTGVNVRDLMRQRIGRTVTAVNDADAAGFAEAVLGAAKNVKGLVIVTTLGTGIGSAFIYNGGLIPNTELGHVTLRGDSAEKYAAASVRRIEDLSWPDWTARLQEYYGHIDMLFSPDMFVVGGGVSERADMFLPHLKLSCPIVPAKLRNTAGIVGGAALAAKAEGLAF